MLGIFWLCWVLLCMLGYVGLCKVMLGYVGSCLVMKGYFRLCLVGQSDYVSLC